MSVGCVVVISGPGFTCAQDQTVFLATLLLVAITSDGMQTTKPMRQQDRHPSLPPNEFQRDEVQNNMEVQEAVSLFKHKHGLLNGFPADWTILQQSGTRVANTHVTALSMNQDRVNLVLHAHDTLIGCGGRQRPVQHDAR
jgi:hypothetical protein